MVVCIGLRGSIAQAIVVLEGQVTECPSVLAAVDRAVKLHYIFNISYIGSSEHVWQLLQKLIYGMTNVQHLHVSDVIGYMNSKCNRTDVQ